MATEMEWSHDFCLSCDRQISEGAYCSQACRLADIEKAPTSEPASPQSFTSYSSSSYSSSNTGLHLPPAVDFSAYKTSTRIGSPQTSPSFHYSHASYLSQPPSTTSLSNHNNPPKRTLTPSSSRSSLSSMSSMQSSQGLSQQAANELKGYMSSFDPIRESRRRRTFG